MPQHLYILTGASRGLGLAMAEQLLAPEHRLLCISRRPSETLPAEAERAGTELEQWALDLGQPIDAVARLQAWLAEFDGNALASATLINNAAMLPRIAPLAESDALEVTQAVRVGLEAPLLLTAAFLRATAVWPARRRVLNISSGLGRRAMAAQAPYCAVKAGLDHFSRAAALDEAGRSNGARVVSLAPGVIDTDMQVQLRAADPAGFPDLANFIALKERSQLASSADAATSVLAYLNRADFGSNPVADVRDA